jgi:hypothetical protein
MVWRGPVYSLCTFIHRWGNRVADRKGETIQGEGKNRVAGMEIKTRTKVEMAQNNRTPSQEAKRVVVIITETEMSS